MSIYFVVLGTDSVPVESVVKVGDVVKARDLARQYNLQLSVHLIQPNLTYVSGKKLVSDYTKLSAESKADNLITVTTGNFDEWTKSDDLTVAMATRMATIVYIHDPKLSSYDIMELLEDVSPFVKNEGKKEEKTARRDVFIVPSVCTIYGLMVEYIMYLANINSYEGILSSPYLPYGGNVVSPGSKYTHQDLKTVKIHMSLTCDILTQYVRAGFNTSISPDSLDDSMSPDSWMLNVESAPIKEYIMYYGLYPEVADRDPALEIRESSYYRYKLTALMAASLANFSINNKLITLEQVERGGGWYSAKTWDLIKSSISEWDVSNLTREVGCRNIPEADLPLASLPEFKRRQPQIKSVESKQTLPFPSTSTATSAATSAATGRGSGVKITELGQVGTQVPSRTQVPGGTTSSASGIELKRGGFPPAIGEVKRGGLPFPASGPTVLGLPTVGAGGPLPPLGQIGPLTPITLPAGPSLRGPL